MQIKNKPQVVVIPGQPLPERISAAIRDTHAPTFSFDSSGALSFGPSSAPATGVSSSQFFGAPSTSAFGASSTPSFGGQSTTMFGASNSPAFGTSNFPSFGAQSTPAFGSSTSLLFGAQSTPALGAHSTPAFDASSAPSFGAQSTRAFGALRTPSPRPSSSLFGSTPTFGTSSSPIFGVSTTPEWVYPPPRRSFPNGSSSQLPGDGFNTQSPCVCAFNSGYQQARANNPAQYYGEDGQIFQSISAMLAHKGIDMSHEELRYIDCRQHRDKGNRVSNSAWIKGTNTNSTSGCGNVQPLPNMSNTTKSNMISISINIEAPSGVVTQLLDLLKSFHINVESSSTSPPTTAPAPSTSFCTAPF